MKIFTVPFRSLLPVLLSIPAFPGRDHLPLVTQDQQHTPGKVPWEGRAGRQRGIWTSQCRRSGGQRETLQAWDLARRGHYNTKQH